jgi:hypothetical protein
MSAGGLLPIAGALLVVGAVAAGMARSPRMAVALAVAGEGVLGGAGLAAGWWVLTGAAWVAGAGLAVQWARLERKARRR